jgi:hypothetical protein
VLHAAPLQSGFSSNQSLALLLPVHCQPLLGHHHCCWAPYSWEHCSYGHRCQDRHSTKPVLLLLLPTLLLLLLPSSAVVPT